MRAKKLLCVMGMTAAATSCAGGIEGPMGPSMAEQIDDYVATLDQLPLLPSRIEDAPPSNPEREGDYSCTRTNLEETRQYDKIVAYGANSESLWPGAIVRGDTMADGLLTQVVFPRKPLAFSISLENLAGPKSIRMEAPALSRSRRFTPRISSRSRSGWTSTRSPRA
jgi:thiol-activated cytolysin